MSVSATSASSRHDSIDSLTGLRFIAAFTIAFGHSYVPMGNITIIGMPLFFTLSGFIIHYVYAESFADGWCSAVPKFAIARFSRIYPLYLALLVVALISTPMGVELAQSGNVGLIVAYISAAYTWLPLMADGKLLGDWYYGISWSVPTEIFFYVAYALVLHRIARIRSARTCFLALIGFCALAYALFYLLFLTRDLWETFILQSYPQFISRTTDFANSFYRWLLYESPYFRIFEFIGGCLTAQLYRICRDDERLRDRLSVEWLAWGGCGLIVFVSALFIARLAYEPWLAIGNHSFGAFLAALHMNFLLAPFCYLVIFALAYGRSTLSRVLSSGIAVLLGEVSYSTYLGHPLAQTFFENSTLTYFAPVSLLLEMATIYGFSWIFYSAIEVPSKTGLRHLLISRSTTRSRQGATSRVAWISGGALIAIGLIYLNYVNGRALGKDSPALELVTTASSVTTLPKYNDVGGFNFAWDGIDGLAASDAELAPVVSNNQPLKLVVSTSPGRHRIGVKIRGFDPGHAYRASVWIKPISGSEFVLDARDGASNHYGTVNFDLSKQTVALLRGNASAPRIDNHNNGWIRISSDLLYGDDLAVLYVGTLSPAGSSQYIGDGQSAFLFGGVEFTREQ